MTDTPEPNPVVFSVRSLTEGRAAAERVGFPLWIRPAFTLRGHGTARCAHREALDEMLSYALTLSPTGEVQIDDGAVCSAVRNLGWMQISLAGREIARLDVLDWTDAKNEELTKALNAIVYILFQTGATLMREQCAAAFGNAPEVAATIRALPLPEYPYRCPTDGATSAPG